MGILFPNCEYLLDGRRPGGWQKRNARLANAFLDARRGQRWYAMRGEGWKGPKHYMHREILGFPEGLDVDHGDGDGLNNQRYNLKPKTRHQNLCGFFRKKAGTTSKFMGVSWYAREQRWIAQIRVDGKNKTLGRFKSEEAAADAYQLAKHLRNLKLGMK